MVTRRATAVVAGVLLAAGVTQAPAASGADEESRNRPISLSPLLWATVNVCDTVDEPNTIGIRASMPGSGIREERMFVRFQVQFKAPKDGKWHNVGAAGDSGFIDIGSGRFKARQSGRNFTILPPDGVEYRLRGAVTFEWRLDGEVVRRARKSTTAGHRNTRGSDPKGFSAASCVVR